MSYKRRHCEEGGDAHRQGSSEARLFHPSLLLLVSLMIPALLFLDRPLIRGDGVAYLAWLDTLLLDQDLDFSNQLQRLQPVNTYQITWNAQTQRFVNIFPFGIALLQAPFYLLGHLFARLGWWTLNADYFHQMQGVGLPYSMWLMIGANSLAIATVIIAWLLASRLCNRWLAAVVTWAVFIGSPLVYYSTVSPLNSHNGGTFMATLFVFLLAHTTGSFPIAEWRRDPPAYQWLLLGLCGGILTLVRWQMGLVVVGGVALLVWQRQWKGLVLAAVALVLSLLPLVVIWNAMFGAPLVVPYEATEGESFLRFLQAPRRSWWVLRDLFRHSPLLLLSVAGFFFLWRLNRLWTLLAGSLILAQAAVNGAVLDWWAGDTYGMRRMTELFPFYVLLTAAALGYMPRSPFAPRFRLRRYVPLAFRLALVLLLAYSFCYMVVFFNFHWTNPDQLFITSPEGMFRHVLNQAHRWEVTIGVWRSHLGPWAWSRPGP